MVIESKFNIGDRVYIIMEIYDLDIKKYVYDIVYHNAEIIKINTKSYLCDNIEKTEILYYVQTSDGIRLFNDEVIFRTEDDARLFCDTHKPHVKK